MALNRRDKFIYGVLIFALLCFVLWKTNTTEEDASVAMSFVGYTNGLVGNQALLNLKNTGPNSILRDAVCTITWSDPRGTNVDFFLAP
jgi:hypothetical protein